MAASIELGHAMYIQIGNSSLRRMSQIVGRGNCTPMRTCFWAKTLIWVNKRLKLLHTVPLTLKILMIIFIFIWVCSVTPLFAWTMRESSFQTNAWDPTWAQALHQNRRSIVHRREKRNTLVYSDIYEHFTQISSISHNIIVTIIITVDAH